MKLHVETYELYEEETKPDLGNRGVLFNSAVRLGLQVSIFEKKVTFRVLKQYKSSDDSYEDETISKDIFESPKEEFVQFLDFLKEKIQTSKTNE